MLVKLTQLPRRTITQPIPYLGRERLVGPDPAADAGVVPGQVLPQVHRAGVRPVAHQAREALLT